MVDAFVIIRFVRRAFHWGFRTVVGWDELEVVLNGFAEVVFEVLLARLIGALRPTSVAGLDADMWVGLAPKYGCRAVAVEVTESNVLERSYKAILERFMTYEFASRRANERYGEDGPLWESLRFHDAFAELTDGAPLDARKVNSDRFGGGTLEETLVE